MMSGMGRVFSYENQEPNPLNPNPELALRKLKGMIGTSILWQKTILRPMEMMGN